MAVTAFAKHAGGAILPERTGRRPLAAAGDERARGRPRGGRDGPVHPEHERDNDLMESYSERPRQVAGGAVPPDHQLPSGANKLERIAQHSKGLVDDLTAWVDLKVKLVQLDVERKVQEKATAALVKAIPLVFFALAAFFVLVTLALGLGWWLGHPFWGFLIVTVLLGIGGLILKRASPRIQQQMMKEPKAKVAEDHLQPIDGHLPGSHPR